MISNWNAFFSQTDFTMALLRSLLVIIWTINNCSFDAAAPERVIVGEDNSINKVSALFVLVQRNIPEMRIPEELNYIIHEYSDYKDIRTLFLVLSVHEDRNKVLGFGKYPEFHQKYPTQKSKIIHLARCGIDFDSDHQFIIGINWIFEPVTSASTGIERHYLRGINWNAVSGLKHLQYLYLGILNFEISIQDLQSLPHSMQALRIEGCIWTGPDLGTNLSTSLNFEGTGAIPWPPGLAKIDAEQTTNLAATVCRTRPGLSDLTPVVLGCRQLPPVDWSALPPPQPNPGPRKRSSWGCVVA